MNVKIDWDALVPGKRYSKQAAAEATGVSPRTIDNYILGRSTLPPGIKIRFKRLNFHTTVLVRSRAKRKEAAE